MDFVNYVVDSLRRQAADHPAAFLSTALVPGLLYWVYQQALPKPLPGIPFVPGHGASIFGSLPDIASHIKEHGVVLPYFNKLNTRLNAPLVQWFSMPFSKPALILCDFQETQDLVIRRTKEVDRTHVSFDAFRPVMPEQRIAMHTWDPRYKRNRELVRDVMSPKFLHEVSAKHIHSKCMSLIELWTLKTRLGGGRPFKAGHDITHSTLSMVVAAAFAIPEDDSLELAVKHLRSIAELPAERRPEALRPEALSKADSSSSSATTVTFPRPPSNPDLDALLTVTDFMADMLNTQFTTWTYWSRWLTDAKLRAAYKTRDAFIRLQITKALQRVRDGDSTQHSATDHFVQRETAMAEKQGRAPDFEARYIADELFGYVVGGQETTSSALSWVIKYVQDHPAIQQTLRESLHEAYAAARSGGRAPTADEIVKTSVPYLDAVIEECLRHAGSTALVARETIEDTVILGHTVPKGHVIFISSVGFGYTLPPLEVDESLRSATSAARSGQAGMRWDSEHFPEHEFIPDRWLQDRDPQTGKPVYNPQAGPFMSFGAGPRACFGQRLAYLKLRIMLVLLVWSFNLRKLPAGLSKYDLVEGISVAPKTFYVGVDPL